MKLRLMTPEGTLFEGETVSVRGRAPGGEFEILPGHGQWVSPIDPCCLTVRAASSGHPATPTDRGAILIDKAAAERLPFAVLGGLIEVHPDSVLILADTAESGTAIDEERAERSRARAEERLDKKSGAEAREIDSDRARRAMTRALARLEACAAKR